MICKNCIHSEVCKHKTEAVYECEHFKEIVRCKECKHCEKWSNHSIWCDKHKVFMSMKPNDFCSRGERKESEVTE